jgi:hypothetical protein
MKIPLQQASNKHYVTMKTTLLHYTLFAAAAIACTDLRAQSVQEAVDYRTTRHGTPVEVLRIENNFTTNQLKFIAQLEKRQKRAYPESRLLVSAADFIYRRNCHDYAWGPYMSCMCSYWPAPQTEAWWMNDPRANWLDSSLVGRAAAVKIAMDTAQNWRRDDARGYEYAFSGTVIDSLRAYYIDPLAQPIPLPTSDVINTTGDYPSHSALMIGVADTRLVLDTNGVPQTGYLCMFQSKWGQQGLWQHRWGTPFCPPLYCQKPSIQVFAPGTGWGDAPPYLIYPSPWGL